MNALLDYYASENFISENIVNSLNLKIFPLSKWITITEKSLNNQSSCFVNLEVVLNYRLYTAICLSIMKDLCNPLSSVTLVKTIKTL